MATITEAKRLIGTMFANENTRLVPLLTGGAGVGKTQLVMQVAQSMGFTVAYVNLAYRQPGEFAINFVDSNNNLGTVIDSVFDADIVFFDELNRAELVMSEVMNIMQSRSVRGVPLTCRFVCAMNTGAAYSVSTLDPAQYGRFANIPVEPSLNEWTLYMHEKHTDNPMLKTVLGFVTKTNTLTTEDDMVTPRTWDEFLTLGSDFQRYVLTRDIAMDYEAYCEHATFPDYDDASGENWVPPYAERDYILGAVSNVSVNRMVELMQLVKIDSIITILADICRLNEPMHRGLMSNPTFLNYIESI